jgi:hypothetical protein
MLGTATKFTVTLSSTVESLRHDTPLPGSSDRFSEEFPIDGLVFRFRQEYVLFLITTVFI